ncbi:MAG: FHA domain-containing protein [Lachnospiraceae bacterium]|nr:FHA domain-containing protein [Lachnospiraceae bacterium]
MKRITKLCKIIGIVLLCTIVTQKNDVNIFATDNNILDTCKKGVVEIQSGFFVGDSKKFYLMSNSSGFIVNNERGKLYIISTYKSSQVSTKRIKKYCKKNSIKIDNRTRFRQITRVVVENDVTTELNMEALSKEENFCLWSSNDVLQEKKALALENQNPAKETDTVYALGYDDQMTFKLNFRAEDVRAAQGVVENSSYTIGKSEYIQYSVVNEKNMSGGPLVSEDGYVLGLTDYTVKCDNQNVGNALNVNRIISLLENYGINYSSRKLDETYQELQAVYDEAKIKYESSEYREYSKASLEEELSDAETILKRTETVSIDKIKEQEEGLKTSEEELVKKNSLITIFKFVMIVLNVIVLIILVLTIIKFVKLLGELNQKNGKVKAKKAKPQKKLPENKKGQQQNFGQPMQMGNPQLGFGQPMQQGNPQLGFGQPMQQGNPQAGFNQPMQQGNPQTGFGQSMQMGNQSVNTEQPLVQFNIAGASMQGGNVQPAVLVRIKTGERFTVQPGDNIIGKSSQNADIVIGGNPAISRRHARISVRNGQYMIADLGSVNGTFLNGMQVSQHETPIKINDTIGIADEMFQFMMGM